MMDARYNYDEVKHELAPVDHDYSLKFFNGQRGTFTYGDRRVMQLKESRMQLMNEFSELVKAGKSTAHLDPQIKNLCREIEQLIAKNNASK